MLANIRRVWPELLWVAAFTPIAVLDHHGGLFLALFCTGVAAAGWAMGHRHRALPLHGKVDRMTSGVSEMLAEIRAGRDTDDAEAPPRLYVVPRGKDTA